MKKKLKFIILLLLLICVFIFPALCGDGELSNPLSFLKPDESADEWNGEQELPQAGTTETVLVPGFDNLVCYADQTSQKVNFYNPQENSCLMRMTLYADKQELWKSGYIEPGRGYYNIELKKPLTAGRYNGILLVECFLNDGTECNAVKVEFIIDVEDKQL